MYAVLYYINEESLDQMMCDISGQHNCLKSINGT